MAVIVMFIKAVCPWLCLLHNSLGMGVNEQRPPSLNTAGQAHRRGTQAMGVQDFAFVHGLTLHPSSSWKKLWGLWENQRSKLHPFAQRAPVRLSEGPVLSNPSIVLGPQDIS